jgi:hypothetical protein
MYFAGAVRPSSRRLRSGGEHRRSPRHLPIFRSADDEPRMGLYAGRHGLP